MLHLAQALNKFGNYYQGIKPVRKYYKECSCAICNEKDKNELTVHHVLPRFIGQHVKIDEFLKCMTVVLCRKCHDEYEFIALRLKQKLAKYLNVDLNVQKYFVNREIEKVRKHAIRLMSISDDSDINFERAHKSREIILTYLSQDSYTRDDLRKVCRTHYKMENPAYKDLGKIMLEKYGFEKTRDFWYDHFLSFEKSKNNCISF